MAWRLVPVSIFSRTARKLSGRVMTISLARHKLHHNHLEVAIARNPNSAISQCYYYLRGHTLSLIWLGYTIAQIRQLRSANVGTDVGCTNPTLDDTVENMVTLIERSLSALRNRLRTYVADLDKALSRDAPRDTKWRRGGPGGRRLHNQRLRRS
jgi:hypothetical protein